ncbi:MAG: fused MFS/spermidine synthase [Gammaproteobacteria bacterium]
MTAIALDSAPTRARRAVLLATALLGGAAVMVLELLGTRIIGPYFGVSLYVWSSLIAVTMVALAIGYYAGGWCADRAPRLRLAHLLVLAALGTLVVPYAAAPVLAATEPLGLRAGAFASATILFLPPLSCLGMIGPMVIKRIAHDLGAVGTASGTVYAVSTVGSVLGTLALGFFLLPVLGTRAILVATGVLLLVSSVVVGLCERRIPQPAVVQSLWLLGLVSGLALAAGSPARAIGADGYAIRSEAESIYGWVRVLDDARNGVRLLLSDGSSIGAVRTGTGAAMLAYQQVLAFLPMLAHSGHAGPAREALLIGLGAGTVASQLARHGIRTDTIEIDPAVARAARADFGFEPNGRFLVGDARQAVRALAGPYDLVIHDCFTGGSEPAHLLTQEALGELRRLMRSDGILALNFVGFRAGRGAAGVAAVSATLASRFAHQRVFVSLYDADFTDFIFLASARPIRFAPADAAQRRHLQRLERHEIAPPGGGRVLTDDYNPIEYLQAGKAERYRQLFVERVPAALLSR